MPDAPVEIEWDRATLADWRRLTDGVQGATLPQSFAYARAMHATERQIARFGVIRDAGGEAGCVLVLERRSLAVLSRISIHRGPLWTRAAPSPSTLAATLALLRRRWPSRPWRKVSFIPELPAGAESHRHLAEAGFRRVGDGYRSILVDLAAPADARRAALRATWRHQLQKAERAGVAVEVDRHGKTTLPWLLQRSDLDRKLRGYRGVSSKLALQLMLAARGGNEATVLIAGHGGERIAGILVIRHGDTATYLLGWTGADGRRLGATHLLLWRAMEALAADGVARLDLGGINPEAAPGLTLFKRGLGGEEYELVGTYT
jgi:hypothetical protein